MSRRARATGFVAAALLAAAAAAAIADGYGDSVVRGYGELWPVVVATAGLPEGEPIAPGRAAEALETRRVPARFAPAGALRSPAEAIGLVPVGPLPAGAYVLAPQLRAPRPGGDRLGLGRGRRPVQVSVGGAAALLAGARAEGGRVDVVVTTEPTGGGRGRTYVAATGVPMLSLAPLPDAGEGMAAATLALTRRQALRLIAAESFARRLTLLPGG